MAKRKRTGRRVQVEDSTGSSNIGSIAIIVIISIVGVMLWATFDLKKSPSTVGGDETLPAYAFVSARSEQSYRAAIDPIIQNSDVFSKIPCYCGCKAAGHTSLKSCFNDDHGSYCDVCQFEALETYEMVKEGVPIGEIRDAIDTRYGNGRFADGTDTPPVA